MMNLSDGIILINNSNYNNKNKIIKIFSSKLNFVLDEGRLRFQKHLQ